MSTVRSRATIQCITADVHWLSSCTTPPPNAASKLGGAPCKKLCSNCRVLRWSRRRSGHGLARSLRPPRPAALSWVSPCVAFDLIEIGRVVDRWRGFFVGCGKQSTRYRIMIAIGTLDLEQVDLQRGCFRNGPIVHGTISRWRRNPGVLVLHQLLLGRNPFPKDVWLVFACVRKCKQACNTVGGIASAALGWVNFALAHLVAARCLWLILKLNPGPQTMWSLPMSHRARCQPKR